MKSSADIFRSVYGRFDAVMNARVAGLATPRTIALDVARSQSDPLRVSLSGDLLWSTDDSTGDVHIRFNSIEAGRVPMLPGMIIQGAPFVEVWLDWDAQAGKVLALARSTGMQITPGNNIGDISNILNPVTVATYQAGSLSWVDTTNTAALQTIKTPAANVNGITVVELSIGSTVTKGRFMHKSSAPSAWDDTNAMSLMINDPSLGLVSQCALPLFLPAGDGLYFQNKNADTGTRSVAYTVH